VEENRPEAEARPRLVVVYGHRSLDVMQIRAAARDLCDLIWLVDGEDPSVAAVRPVLERFGVVVDALAQSPQQAAAAVRVQRPDGLTTFYDTGMEQIAAIAAELGLPFHSAEAGRALEDKVHQREAFRRAGLPTPRTVALPAGADRATVQRLGGEVSYPAVLKPRRASGSWHTFRVESLEALDELWAELAAGEPEELMLEEYLPDGPPMPHGFEADYVSVETVVVGGEMTHLAVTGRFPLAPPFRETGFFIPATIGPEVQREVVELAGQALQALGFRVGTAHTEIKLTADGLRLIEINGRVGGGVPEMLRLAAGVDIMRLTIRAALGLELGVSELPPSTGVAYRFFYQPPSSARRVTAIDGLDRLKQFPGVESVYLHHPPGAEIDARHGTRAYLFAVVGSTADYAGVLAVEEFMRTQIEAVYEHA
jgi:biotin carboxylase